MARHALSEEYIPWNAVMMIKTGDEWFLSIDPDDYRWNEWANYAEAIDWFKASDKTHSHAQLNDAGYQPSEGSVQYSALFGWFYHPPTNNWTGRNSIDYGKDVIWVDKLVASPGMVYRHE